MKVKYTILDPANPDVSRIGELECPDDGSDPMSDVTNYDALNALWKANFPGVMEHVTVWHEGKYTDMFVDDMGACNGLPTNKQATLIYWANQLPQHPLYDCIKDSPDALYGRGVIEDWPHIHGPAILFHSEVWF